MARALIALIAAGATIIAAPAALADAPKRPDLLDRPAAAAPHAGQQLLLAAAYAGKRIVAVGQGGEILLSDDDARSWHLANFVPTSVTLTGVAFANDHEGWVIGHLGIVLHTSDGGMTWQRQLDGIQAALVSLSAAQREAHDVPGDVSTKALRLARMGVEEGPDKPFLALIVKDPRHVTVLGAYGMAYGTDDGGKTWSPVDRRFSNAEGLHYYGANLYAGELVLVGERGMVLRGPEGGQLIPMRTPYGGSFFGVVQGGPSTLIAYGLQGTIVVSHDSGATWKKMETGVTTSFEAGTVLSDGTIVLASESGQVVVSQDGGDHFAIQPVLVEPAAGLLPLGGASVLVVGPRGAQRFNVFGKTEYSK